MPSMNDNSTHPISVSVVGAGLAGLSAAYQLSRDPRFSVSVFEARDRVGGRTYTYKGLPVPIDTGGFIIYPWYTVFHDYIEELRLAHELSPIPELPIHYDIAGSGLFTDSLSIADWWREFRLGATLKHVGVPAFFNQDPRRPNIHVYKESTLGSLLRSCQRIPGSPSKILSFFDAVSQGYCYAPLDQMSPSLGIPVIIKSSIQGDVRSSYYFKKGISLFYEALADSILQSGGSIHLDSPVLAIDPDSRSLTLASSKHTSDYIILAQPFNDLSRKALGVSDSPSYTTFSNIIAQFPSLPYVQNTSKWGALFLKAVTTDIGAPQILSVVNLEKLYGATGMIALNVRHSRKTDPSEDLSFLSHLQSEFTRLFPRNKGSISFHQHWPETMPIMSDELIQVLRDKQGVHGIFYAGDCLGSPSMETALSSGIDAADLIRQSI